MNEKKKIKMLTDVKKLLDKEDIEFFPLYGTLLGFVRGKHIMPWDGDMDFGAWYQDYYKVIKLKDDFEKLGYGMGDSGIRCKYCHISIFYKEDGPYDFHAGISFWARDNDKVVALKFFDKNLLFRLFGMFKKNKIYDFFAPFYRGLILFINKHEALPYSFFENMEKIKVYGMDFKIISNYEHYLKIAYGENWRKPDKKWTRKKSQKCFKKLKTRYKIQDKNIRYLWLKREDIDD